MCGSSGAMRVLADRPPRELERPRAAARHTARRGTAPTPASTTSSGGSSSASATRPAPGRHLHRRRVTSKLVPRRHRTSTRDERRRRPPTTAATAAERSARARARCLRRSRVGPARGRVDGAAATSTPAAPTTRTTPRHRAVGPALARSAARHRRCPAACNAHAATATAGIPASASSADGLESRTGERRARRRSPRAPTSDAAARGRERERHQRERGARRRARAQRWDVFAPRREPEPERQRRRPAASASAFQ